MLYRITILFLASYFIARLIVADLGLIQRVKVKLELESRDWARRFPRGLLAKLLNCTVCCTGWASLALTACSSGSGHWPHWDWPTMIALVFATAGLVTVGERSGNL